jgi:hypothetical protein
MFFTDLMKGAAEDFVAVIEGRPPSEEDHRNSGRFLREVGLLSKELRGIIPTTNETMRRTADQMDTSTDSDEEAMPKALVVISIDEAHVLMEDPLPSFARRTAFHIFAGTISHLALHPVAFTAMSTNLRLGALATSSSRNTHPSTDETEDVVFPVPFTQLSFDIFAYDDDKQRGIAREDLTLEDVSKTGFFVKFGRPL